MKANLVGLQNDVVSVYDKTKTTVSGRAIQKTINSELVIGPPLTKAVDIFTDTLGAFTPTYMYLSTNNRLFTVSAIATGTGQICLHNFNTDTGVFSYVGRIIFNMPNTAATTHTIRGLKVNDDNPAAIRIYLAATGSVLINGGLFLINNLNVTDFVPVGLPTIGMGIASNAKAVYSLQEPGAVGAGFLMTSSAGFSMPMTSANPAINTKIYVHNGTAAVHQFYVFENANNPTVNIQTTTAATSIGSPTFNLTGHGYNNNDQVVIIANAPTPFTLSTTIAQTVYFIRNATANTFELSATSGGASINATSVTASTQVLRAFGEVTNMFVHKTGNLPALTGTLLAVNSEDHAIPQHTANSGQDCVFFASTTRLYLGRYSDLTVGAVTFPTLIEVNVLGTGIDITAPTPVNATWSNSCDKAVFLTNTNIFVVKEFVNSAIVALIGSSSNQYIEAQNSPTLPFRLLAISAIETRNGWLLISGSTVGQRVVVAVDIRSDDYFDYSNIVSPILNTAGQTFKYLQTLEQLYDRTDYMTFYYRTAATNSDPLFNTASGGWTAIETAQDLSAFVLDNYTQFKVGFGVMTFLENTPAQIHDLVYTTMGLIEMSNYWEGSVDNSSLSSASPMYVAFRLKSAYGTLPTKFKIRGVDDSNNVIFLFDSLIDGAVLTQSTNNGTSWAPWTNMAGFPNVALTTELRVEVLSPSGTRLSWSIQEE